VSFICEYCNKPQKPKTKPIRIPIETRGKIYPVRFAEDEITIIDNGGKGHETVKEMNFCKECFDKWLNKE
jgi:hypothetical protein